MFGGVAASIKKFKDESNDETWNPSNNDYVEVVDIEEEAPDNEAEIIQDTHDKKGKDTCLI